MSASLPAQRVRVVCPCGKKYRVRDKVIGKRVRCRACGDLFEAVAGDIKRNQAASSPTECPGCGEGLLPDVSFCFICGYDVETGQHLVRESTVVRRPKKRDTTFVPSQTNRRASARNDSESSNSAMPVLPVLLGALTFLVLSYFLQAEMGGRTFLAFYGVVLTGCWILSELSREKGEEWRPLAIFIATFVAVGVLRVYYGWNHGMGKFALLFVMMCAGTLMIAVGVNKFVNKNTDRDLKLYMYPPGIVVALTVGCLLWTVIGHWSVIIAVLLSSALFGNHSGGYGSGYHSNCNSCGGGGCGGGGCGGCGGD